MAVGGESEADSVNRWRDRITGENVSSVDLRLHSLLQSVKIADKVCIVSNNLDPIRTLIETLRNNEQEGKKN